MKHLLLLLFTSFIVAPEISAQLPQLIFHAELKGEEQIPAVSTAARGLITIMYSPDRTKVSVTGLFVDMEGDITDVSLHIGKTGETGSQIVDLMPLLNFRRLYGEIEVPAALLQNLLPDRVYATVSTNANPGGEIRGQFICETDLDYRTVLTGAGVVPAANSSSFGFGGIHFPTGSEDVVVALLVDGLSGPITEAGIYFGNPGENGILVHSLTQFFLNFIQEKIELSELPADFFRNAREGKYYIQVNTAAYPNGELRGQIDFLGYFTSFAPVNSAQAVPSTPSAGFGFSHNILNTTLDSLTSTVYISTVTPAAVEIRKGAPGTMGVLLETLELTSTPGVYSKTWPLDADRMTALVEGNLYVNVPTAARPAGEIRGQLKNSLRKGYAFDLCGNQVVPPVNSDGYGVAMASVDQANCYINYKLIYDKLTGDVTDGFICEANPGQNGTALYALSAQKPVIPGDDEILATHGVSIENGGMYMILRTQAWPEGEIRGQIRRGNLSCPEQSDIQLVGQVSDIQVNPTPFYDNFTVKFDSKRSFQARLILRDMLGAPVLIQSVNVSSGAQTFYVQAPSLLPGVYSLSLEIPDGSGMLLKKIARSSR
ncbi:MAG: hypothetical protein RLZ62_2272 [Bacteroidota bacterium]|jgi:hypothetical protein